MKFNYISKSNFYLQKWLSTKILKSYFLLLLLISFSGYASYNLGNDDLVLTMSCEVQSFPFFETFEDDSDTRDCWTQIQETGSANWTFAAGSSAGAISTAFDGSLNARFVSQSGSNSPITKLVTPEIDLSSVSEAQLTFYYGQQTWFNDQNELKVYYRTASDQAWVEIAHYKNNISSWTEETLLLPETSATMQVAFEGINNWGHTNVIDNVSIEEAPSCIAPQNIAVSNITTTTADLDWDAETAATTGYDYFVTSDGTVPDGSTTPTGSVATGTTSASLSGLTLQTDYDVYVRSDCSSGDVSDWSNAVSFSTLCEAISSFPYLQDFDGTWSGSPAAPDCWVVVNNDGDIYTWTQSSQWLTPLSGSSTAHGMGNQDDYLITPAFEIPAGENYEIFWHDIVESSTRNNTYDVLVSITNTDITSFTDNLGTFDTTNEDWEERNLDLSAYAGQTIYIAFHQTFSASAFWGFGLDDFSISEIPTCITPENLAVSNITATSADLDWEAEVTATDGYEWVIMSQGDTPDLDTAVTNATTTLLTESVSGLAANTSYSAYVRSDCGGGDISNWSIAVDFTTLCNPVSDFTEDFNMIGTGEMPDCWDTIIQTGSTFSSIGISSFEDFTLPNAVRMSNGFTTTGEMIAISPQLSSLGEGTHWLKLDAVSSNASNNLIIGTLSDPNDASTFTPLETLDLSTSLESFEVLFTSYTGSDNFIGFKRELTTTSNSVYFDNVVWEVAPTCFPPDNFDVDNIAATDADLSWDTNPDAEEGYEWVIMSQGDAADVATAIASGTTTETTAEVTDLTAETDYSAYVRSVCSIEDESEWTNAVNFSTTVSCASPTNITAVSPYGFAAEFNWDESLTATDGYEWGVYLQGESPLLGDTPVDDGSVVAGTTGFDIDTLDPESDYSFFIRSNCDSGAFSDWSAAVDFSTGAGCPIITGYDVTNITSSSAVLSWSPSANPSATDYNWRLVPTGINPEVAGEHIASGTVGASGPFEVTITGLDPNTTYDFNVRYLCVSEAFSDVGDVITFTTECETFSIPWSENFDGLATGAGNVPGCWETNNNSGTAVTSETSIRGLNPKSGSHYIWSRWSSNNDMYTPGFDLTASESYRFSFWYAESDGSSGHAVEIYAGTSPDIASMTSIGTITNPTNTSWEEFVVDYDAPTSDTYYFAINVSSNFSPWYLGFDEFSVTETPTCEAPQNIAVSNITTTTADLDWSATTSGESDGYQYILVTDGSTPDFSDFPTGSVDTGITTATLTGLTMDTDYDVFVRALCDGSAPDLSDWSNAVSFSTPLLEASPWTEDFDVAGQDGWDLTGWTRGNVGSDAFTDRNVVGRDDSDVLYRNLWGTGASQTGSFETVSVGLVQAGDYLSYEYKISNFASPFGAPDPGSCEFTVSITGSDTGVVEVQDFTNDGKLGWHKKYFDLSAFEGEEVVVSVSAQRISGDFYLFFDNFAIKNINNYVYVDDATGWVGDPFSGGPPGPFAEIAEGSTSFEGFENLSELVVFAQANLDIEGVLDLSGDLYTDGEVTFKSTATKTGQLSPMISGDLIGEVTVERYIQAGDANNRAFRFVTSAVDAGSIYNNWQEGGNSPSGFGTHITGSDTGANGFDQTATGNSSMYSFDNAAASQAGGAAWTEMPNTDATNLEAGMPYRLFVRGDRNIDLSSNDPTPNNTVLRAKGSLKIGTVPAVDLATGDGQFSFIGNPYQAIVNINGVTISGDVNDNYIYAWDANAGDNGAYVTVELPAGTNPASNPNVNNLLQPGQAVFIRNNTVVTTAGSIDFTEFSKSVSASQLSPFSDEALTKVDFQLFTTAAFADNSNPSDAVGLRFDENYNPMVDDADAGKLGNSGENLAIVEENQLLSIEQRTFPVGEESIQLFVNNYQHEDYVFKAIAQNLPEGKAVFIKDNYLDTVTEMDLENGYAFSIDQNIPESTSIFRFELVFENETLGVNNYLSEALRLYPVPVEDVLHIASSLDTDLKVEVYNMLGQQVAKSNIAASQDQSISMQGLEAGVYIVKISDGEAVHNQQIIKK